MTNEERASLRATADAATPGPWEAPGGRSHVSDIFEEGDHTILPPLGQFGPVAIAAGEANAAFIAASRAAVPALLDENARLREALGGLVELYEDDEGCASLPQIIAARAALSAAPPLPEPASPWRDIATAPTNTRLLAARGGHVAEASLCDYPGMNAWYWGDQDYPMNSPPDAWQPLPEPPAAQAGEDV